MYLFLCIDMCRVHVHICMYACAHVRMRCVPTGSIAVLLVSVRMCVRSVYACMHTCVYACMYEYIYMCALCIDRSMHVYMYVYMRTYVLNMSEYRDVLVCVFV
jgi:hypothetical protein